jgi:hypothetical protein
MRRAKGCRWSVQTGGVEGRLLGVDALKLVRAWRAWVVALLLSLAGAAVGVGMPGMAAAAVPTNYFTLGTDLFPVPAPAPYTPVKAIYAETYTWHGQSLGPFSNIQDVFVDSKGDVWVVDTGNNRIVEFNPTLTKVLLVIGGPNATGPAALNGPEGMAVRNGLVYVADTGNSRLAVFAASNGAYIDQLQPLNESLTLRSLQVKFVPEKVAVGEDGTIYVAIAGQPYGLAKFSPTGQFEGFFAPNNVGYNLGYHIAKLLESPQQRAQNAPILPPEVNNVLIGPNGYIYTTSVDTTSDQIRRLNAVGTDTLNLPGTNLIYGLPISSLPEYVFQNLNEQAASSSGPISANALQPLLVSIAVDKNGVMTVIDQLTDYVMQYSPDGHLLYTWGGLDNGDGILGLFEQPTAVAQLPNGDILVSDGLENNLTIFKPTQFAKDVQQGAVDYYSGQYRRAIRPWTEALKYDSDYDLAHDEIAEGLLSEGEGLGSTPSVYKAQLALFSQAIRQFYLAGDKTGFGEGFAWYRHIWMRLNFTWLFLTVLGGWLFLWLLNKYLRAYLRDHPIEFYGAWVRNQFVRMWPMAWRVLRHPAEAFFQLKYENQGTLYQGLVLIALAFVLQIMRLAWTDFDFSPLVPGRTNLLVNAGQFLLPLATWIAANFMVGDMYDGEADLSEIIYGSAYALMPFIVMALPLTVLSHTFAPSDGFYPFFVWLQKIWVLYMFFTQVRVFHNLEWNQAFKASLVTVVGIGVLWTMMAIGIGLGEQVYSFVTQIIQEIILLRS